MGPGLAAGVLAAQSVNILLQGCLPSSRLRLRVPIALLPAMGPTLRDSRAPVARGAHCSANCNGPKQRVQRDEPS